MSADLEEGGSAGVRLPATLPAELGSFLFAELETGPGRTPLTILSALARLGLDPWDEAGRLAGLPHQEAASELARSLAALPGAPLLDAGVSAIELAALLPGRAAASQPSLARFDGTSLQAVRRQAALLAAAAVFTCLALLLVGHLAAGGGRTAASQPPSAAAGSAPR